MADTVTIESLEEDLAAMTARAEAAETEADELRRQLSAQKAATTKAKNRAAVLKGQASPEARPIGAMKPAKTEEQAADRAAALEGAFAADMTQLVFSDGKREIRELAPLEIGGDAWRATPQGRVLDHEPMLEPGDCQRESFELRGFALLNAEGDQVAYQALPSPITIARNRLYQLPKNTIRF